MATHVKKATVVDIWQSALDNGLDFHQPMSGLFTSLRQTGQESLKICQSSFPLYSLCFTSDSYKKPTRIPGFESTIGGSKSVLKNLLYANAHQKLKNEEELAKHSKLSEQYYFVFCVCTRWMDHGFFD